MLRRFLRDSALYSASAVLSRGIGIILLPLYTRFLHPAEYGALDLLMVFATLANYLISLEISQGVARVYAEAKTVEEKRSCVSSAAWFATAAYGLFAIFASIFPVHIAKWLLGSTQWADAAQAMIFACTPPQVSQPSRRTSAPRCSQDISSGDPSRFTHCPGLREQI